MSTFWELFIGWGAIAMLVAAALILLEHNFGGNDGDY